MSTDRAAIAVIFPSYQCPGEQGNRFPATFTAFLSPLPSNDDEKLLSKIKKRFLHFAKDYLTIKSSGMTSYPNTKLIENTLREY
ncbi:hypothetical protein, partial [Photobacterium halotolerans]|uniref:hypothetical protein n=1 Tax=Photobacterium halotolerans TaxID=265726 RepID=UPI001F32D65C